MERNEVGNVDKTAPKGQIRIDPDWKGCVGFIMPIFPAVIMLFVGSREEFLRHSDAVDLEFNKRLSAKERMMERDGFAHTITEGVDALIRLPKLDMSDELCVGQLYHEALHAALNIVTAFGLEIGKGGEILTYLQGYIVSRLLEEVRKSEEEDVSTLES